MSNKRMPPHDRPRHHRGHARLPVLSRPRLREARMSAVDSAILLWAPLGSIGAGCLIFMTYSKRTAASSVALIARPEDFASRIAWTCDFDASFLASKAARFITFLPRFVSALAIKRKVITAIEVCGFSGNCGIQAGIGFPRMIFLAGNRLVPKHHTILPRLIPNPNCANLLDKIARNPSQRNRAGFFFVNLSTNLGHLVGVQS